MVADLLTVYHHDSPVLVAMKDHGTQRVFNPQDYMHLNPLPQDQTNYLRQPGWGILCPGVRATEGCSMAKSSSSGILSLPTTASSPTRRHDWDGPETGTRVRRRYGGIDTSERQPI